MPLRDDPLLNHLWTVTPGVAGVNWIFTVGTPTSASPTIQFILPGTYTVTLNETTSVGAALVPPVNYNCSTSTTVVVHSTSGA